MGWRRRWFLPSDDQSKIKNQSSVQRLCQIYDDKTREKDWEQRTIWTKCETIAVQGLYVSWTRWIKGSTERNSFNILIINTLATHNSDTLNSDTHSNSDTLLVKKCPYLNTRRISKKFREKFFSNFLQKIDYKYKKNIFQIRKIQIMNKTSYSDTGTGSFKTKSWKYRKSGNHPNSDTYPNSVTFFGFLKISV